MNDEELRPQMFGITSPCIIKSMELAVAAKRLGIEVAPLGAITKETGVTALLPAGAVAAEPNAISLMHAAGLSTDISGANYQVTPSPALESGLATIALDIAGTATATTTTDSAVPANATRRFHNVARTR